jgi:hypothetical protein
MVSLVAVAVFSCVTGASTGGASGFEQNVVLSVSTHTTPHTAAKRRSSVFM